MKLYNYVILIARGRDPTSGLSGVNKLYNTNNQELTRLPKFDINEFE